MRSYKATGGVGGQFGAFTLSSGEYDSKNEAFPIPYIAKNWKFANDSALSVVFYGRGGMNTEWDSGQSVMTDPTGQGGAPSQLPGLYGGGKAGVNLSQAFLNINYSGKIGDRAARAQHAREQEHAQCEGDQPSPVHRLHPRHE